jgi:hypothetical protein
MKLVQLSIALSFAGALMLSGCSKEDVQVPEPKSESVNTNSNLKTESAIPFIQNTNNNYQGEGFSFLASGWQRNNEGFSSNAALYPVGTSTRTYLWGETSFLNTMPVIPWITDISLITVTTYGSAKSSKSAVKTKITGLIPGKKYSLTVYVGSNLPKPISGKPIPTYAKSCVLTLGNPTSTQEIFVDMSNSYYNWIQKVITFTASSATMDFGFSASPGQSGQYAYAHLLVPYGAIKKFNW